MRKQQFGGCTERGLCGMTTDESAIVYQIDLSSANTLETDNALTSA